MFNLYSFYYDVFIIVFPPFNLYEYERTFINGRAFQVIAEEWKRDKGRE